MKRDSQRQALYNWERAIIDRWPECNRGLSLAECRQLIEQVWEDYRPGQQPPEVQDGRGCTSARGGRWRLVLPRWSRTQIVVLHEIGHSLASESPWHGPIFARLFLELMGHYAKVPTGEAKSMAVHQRPRRVRFAQAADAPKRASAEWKEWLAEDRRLAKILAEHNARRPK